MANKTGLYISGNRSGKYGIGRWSDKTLILAQDYENIYRTGKDNDFFVLVKAGKIGLSKATRNEGETAYSLEVITPCENNSIECGGSNTLLLNHKKGTRYYNIRENKLSDFYKSVFTLPLSHYIQAQAEDMFYLIDKETDEVIYQQEHSYKSNPIYLREIGKTKDGNAVFREWGSPPNALLYKNESGYKFLDGYVVLETMSHKGVNLANIVDGKDGIGLVDGNGNFLSDVDFDRVETEYKIKLTKNGESVEQVISSVKHNSLRWFDSVIAGMELN